MGQEERKNKAKLEKTQISLATSNTEYEQAVKALEETTARWNREWQAAADKFQDLEEERLDFTKSSLWTFANIASTVCVSDDASCEKIRLSLETMDVEQDIVTFITERGTGQEIPDAPKYINFCRGDINDNQSEVSEDENYSVAQFPRSINPAFRSSSPQPSTFESHHDPNSALAHNLAHRDPAQLPSTSREPTLTPQKATPQPVRASVEDHYQTASPQPVPISIDDHIQRLPPQPVRASIEDHYQRPSPQPTRISSDLQYQRQSPVVHASIEDHYQRSSPQPTRISTDVKHQRQPSMVQASAEDRYQRSLPQSTRISVEVQHQKPSSAVQPFTEDRYQRPSLQPTRISTETQYQKQSSVVQSSTENRYQRPSPQPIRLSTEVQYQKQSSAVQPATEDRYQRPSPQTTKISTEIQYQKQMPAVQPSNEERYQRPSPQPMQISTEVQYQKQSPAVQASSPYEMTQHVPLASVPHDPYPKDGMTMLCRTGPPSDRSSQPASARPSSRDSHSEYSNPTSFSSQEPPSGKTSPVKQEPEQSAASPEKRVLKKRSGFFQNHSPFRRKSTKDMQASSQSNRNTWHAASSQNQTIPVQRPQMYNQEPQTRNLLQDRTASPEPIDANASLALGVGQNVLPVTTPDTRSGAAATQSKPVEADPIAIALAELKDVHLGKQSSVRMSADHYHGIASPNPGAEAAVLRSSKGPASHDAASVTRGTPPPSYQQQPKVTRLGVPPPAVTSKAMKEASKKMASQTRSVYGDNGRRGSTSAGDGTSPVSRPTTRSVYGDNGRRGSTSAGGGTPPISRPTTRGTDIPRSVSPAPTRSVSPQPRVAAEPRRMSAEPRRVDRRSVSPNPYASHHQRAPSQASTSRGRGSEQSYYRQPSPNPSARGVSPSAYSVHNRPQSSYGGSDMAVQLAPVGDDPYGSQRSRGSGRPESRAMGLYEGGSHQRSRSVADPSRLYTRDGRPILHMGKFSISNANVHKANQDCSPCSIHISGGYSRRVRFCQE